MGWVTWGTPMRGSMRQLKFAAIAAGIAAAALWTGSAQAKVEMKLAHFVTPKHTFSKWLVKWAKEVEQKSGGEITFKIFPGSQMGPPPKYYDIARTGRAEVVWSAHGFTPGRFPLTELSNMPFLIGSAEIGTKVLNDPTLRSKYLDKEHKGVKVLALLTHQPGNINTANKPVRTIKDMKGLRIRFASQTIRAFIRALGGTPRGLPPTQIVEQMQKGTLDGAFIDYGGAGIAFRMGPVTKYTTEMYSYVTSFCVCMNKRAYDSLSPKLKKVIDDSMTGREKELGHAFDVLDAIGKKIMMKAGTTPIKLSAAEAERFRQVGAKVTEARIADLEKKGLPARAVYNMMKALSDKHAKTSLNFMKQ